METSGSSSPAGQGVLRKLYKDRSDGRFCWIAMRLSCSTSGADTFPLQALHSQNCRFPIELPGVFGKGF